MTDTTISPLRLRMIEDMTIRKFAPQASDQPFHEGMRNWRVMRRRKGLMALSVMGLLPS